MLIVSKSGDSRRLERQAFADEADLQRYIYENPEAIPLDEIAEGRRLHVLGREFPTDSGPIDALGTDSDGAVYIIETKLFKNADKRLVLAQVLDYGAALWAAAPSADAILESLRRDATRRKTKDPLERLAAFTGTDEAHAVDQIRRLASSLAEGRFTAVVLMDQLSDRLRDLIAFMNENCRFRVLAAELDYYRDGDTEIVSPRIFGAEARKAREASGGDRGTWQRSDFLERLGKSVDPATVAAVVQLLDFVTPLGRVGWGSGVANPSMNPYFIAGWTKAPLTIEVDGTFVLKLGWVKDAPSGALFVATATDRIRQLGLALDTDKSGRVRWSASAWVPKAAAIVGAFRAALSSLVNSRGHR